MFQRPRQVCSDHHSKSSQNILHAHVYTRCGGIHIAVEPMVPCVHDQISACRVRAVWPIQWQCTITECKVKEYPHTPSQVVLLWLSYIEIRQVEILSPGGDSHWGTGWLRVVTVMHEMFRIMQRLQMSDMCFAWAPGWPIIMPSHQPFPICVPEFFEVFEWRMRGTNNIVLGVHRHSSHKPNLDMCDILLAL